MGALTEFALHSRRQGNTGLAEAVAQAVGGGKSLLPALAPLAFQQVPLHIIRAESGSVHAQQSHFGSLAPVPVEQSTDLPEDFGIQLGGGGESVGAGDGGEVLVAQLQLNGAGVEVGFP